MHQEPGIHINHGHDSCSLHMSHRRQDVDFKWYYRVVNNFTILNQTPQIFPKNG